MHIEHTLISKWAGLMDLQVHQSVVDAGDTETGCTVHQVIEEVDGGDVVCQLKVPVTAADTAETLKSKVTHASKYPTCWHPFLTQKCKTTCWSPPHTYTHTDTHRHTHVRLCVVCLKDVFPCITVPVTRCAHTACACMPADLARCLPGTKT